MPQAHALLAGLSQGSGSIKAGFAGADLPKAFFNSCVGRPKHTRAMAGAVEGDAFIGRKAQDLRGLLRLKYPMEHGIITDFDDMEKIWTHIYNEELKTMSEEVRHPSLPSSYQFSLKPTFFSFGFLFCCSTRSF